MLYCWLELGCPPKRKLFLFVSKLVCCTKEQESDLIIFIFFALSHHGTKLFVSVSRKFVSKFIFIAGSNRFQNQQQGNSSLPV